MAKLVDVEVPLEPTVWSPHSIALPRVLETLYDSTIFVLVDQHMVVGVPIDEHK